jgi:hypothetical protein
MIGSKYILPRIAQSMRDTRVSSGLQVFEGICKHCRER